MRKVFEHTCFTHTPGFFIPTRGIAISTGEIYIRNLEMRTDQLSAMAAALMLEIHIERP
jgi:hypothetical protein